MRNTQPVSDKSPLCRALPRCHGNTMRAREDNKDAVLQSLSRSAISCLPCLRFVSVDIDRARQTNTVASFWHPKFTHCTSLAYRDSPFCSKCGQPSTIYMPLLTGAAGSHPPCPSCGDAKMIPSDPCNSNNIQLYRNRPHPRKTKWAFLEPPIGTCSLRPRREAINSTTVEPVVALSIAYSEQLCVDPRQDRQLQQPVIGRAGVVLQ